MVSVGDDSSNGFDDVPPVSVLRELLSELPVELTTLLLRGLTMEEAQLVTDLVISIAEAPPAGTHKERDFFRIILNKLDIVEKVRGLYVTSPANTRRHVIWWLMSRRCSLWAALVIVAQNPNLLGNEVQLMVEAICEVLEVNRTNLTNLSQKLSRAFQDKGEVFEPAWPVLLVGLKQEQSTREFGKQEALLSFSFMRIFMNLEPQELNGMENLFAFSEDPITYLRAFQKNLSGRLYLFRQVVS